VALSQFQVRRIVSRRATIAANLCDVFHSWPWAVIDRNAEEDQSSGKLGCLSDGNSGSSLANQ
jgi:hypothetical protein